MRYSKYFAGFALAVGLALSGASNLRAADWQQGYYERQDIRRDYNAVERLRRAVAEDRARLDADYRYGRRWATDRDRRQLMRDERALTERMRDVRHDRWDRY
jgi:hypothetical protein